MIVQRLEWEKPLRSILWSGQEPDLVDLCSLKEGSSGGLRETSPPHTNAVFMPVQNKTF